MQVIACQMSSCWQDISLAGTASFAFRKPRRSDWPEFAAPVSSGRLRLICRTCRDVPALALLEHQSTVTICGLLQRRPCVLSERRDASSLLYLVHPDLRNLITNLRSSLQRCCRAVRNRDQVPFVKDVEDNMYVSSNLLQ